MHSYDTIDPAARPEAEIEEKKSRFIAQLAHVESEREARAFVEEIQTKHRDARHNVPVWILADGREKRSDDGEPQGSAGQPTLDVLRGANLKDVCCVTTRYFGGTLLGQGGLVRAYTAAVQAALDAARTEGAIKTMCAVVRVTCCIPYSAYEAVKYMAEQAHGVLKDSIFAEDVQLTWVFSAGDEESFVAALKEKARGEDLCQVSEPYFGEL
ncbi:MAG: IMPACT family protein [Atopobiaceae bacterium]|jgi:uncharacterized YigZ family protein